MSEFYIKGIRREKKKKNRKKMEVSNRSIFELQKQMHKVTDRDKENMKKRYDS